MHRLKNVIFFQPMIRFVLSRKLINTYNGLEQRTHGNVTVKDFCKYDKLEYKKNKLKLGIDFLNNCKQLGVYPKFLIFKGYLRYKIILCVKAALDVQLMNFFI